jgi:hypothetical protein
MHGVEKENVMSNHRPHGHRADLPMSTGMDPGTSFAAETP